MSKKLKILVVYQYFLDHGEPGLSRFNKLVEYWEKEGHQITILAGNVHYSTGIKKEKYKGKFVYREIYSENVEVVKTYVSESYNKSFLGRLWGYFSFTISSTTTLLFNIKKHDVIIVSSPPLFIGITGLVGKYIKKMPFIFETRDIWPQSAIDLGILRNKLLIGLSYKMEKLFYKKADHNVVLTPAFEEYLVEEKKIKKDKISIVTNGADLDTFYPIKDKSEILKMYPELKNKFIITYFGSHSVANKIDLLLKCARGLKEYTDIVFLFIGSGKEKENLLEYASIHELKNVIFMDSMPRDELNKIANLSNVCTTVLPDINVFKTVYPSKLFDYMALGKPILIGFSGIAKDLILKNNIGIYANVEDSEEFKKAILYFYNNPELCKEMSIQSRYFAETYFDREKIAREYITVIETTLNKYKKMEK